MGGPLNVQPRGLLSLFDLKQGGRAPIELGEMIVPQIDLLRWYVETSPALELQVQTFTGLVADTAPGLLTGGTAITPATGEAWYVRRAFVAGVLNAAAVGTLFGLHLAIVKPQLPAFPIFVRSRTSGTFPFQGSATVATNIIVEAEEDFILSPGDLLSVWHDGYDFNAQTLNTLLTAQFVRLKV